MYNLRENKLIHWLFYKDFSDRWWVNRYHDKADRRAMADPRYREIKEREDGKWVSNEERGITIDMWFEQYEIRDRITPRPWWYRLHWWLEIHGVRPTYSNLKFFYQRGKQGFSIRDTWNFEGYLARTIRDGVRHLKENQHGWPGESNGVASVEEWEKILDKIADGFDAYLKMELSIDNKELLSAYDNGMELFAKYFPHLWD